MSLIEKLARARNHVAGTGHRQWSLEKFGRPLEDGSVLHGFMCLGESLSMGGKHRCSSAFEIWFTEDEIAEAGRLDLLDRYGLAEELESIKRVRPLARLSDWDRLLDRETDGPPDRP